MTNTKIIATLGTASNSTECDRGLLSPRLWLIRAQVMGMKQAIAHGRRQRNERGVRTAVRLRHSFARALLRLRRKRLLISTAVAFCYTAGTEIISDQAEVPGDRRDDCSFSDGRRVQTEILT